MLAAAKSSLPPGDWAAADTTEAIESAAKAAMWVCSSSTNGKRVVDASGKGGYYEGDPVVPKAQARVWVVLEGAAGALQKGVVVGRVPGGGGGGGGGVG